MADDLFGVLAEFDSPEALVAATKRAREAGYTRIDAYAPYPVEGLAQALGCGRTKIPWAKGRSSPSATKRLARRDGFLLNRARSLVRYTFPSSSLGLMAAGTCPPVLY